MNTLIEEFLRKLDHSYKYTTECERDLIEADLEEIFNSGRKDGIEIAQQWLPISELKECGVDCIFKQKNGRMSTGALSFIEGKLCIVTDSGYSLITDTWITHYRPIERL